MVLILEIFLIQPRQSVAPRYQRAEGLMFFSTCSEWLFSEPNKYSIIVLVWWSKENNCDINKKKSDYHNDLADGLKILEF